MAIIRSTKVRLITHSPQEEAVLRYLQDKKIFHITSRSKERAELDRGGSYMWAKIESAIRFLAPYNEKKRGLKYALIRDKVVSSEAEVEKLAKEFDLEKVLQDIHDLEVEKNKTESALLKTQEQEIILNEWKDVELRGGFHSERFLYAFCRFPNTAEEALKQDMAGLPEMVHFEILGATKVAVLGFIVFDKQNATTVKNFISNHDGVEMHLNIGDSSPRARYQEVIAQREELEKNLQKTEDTICAAAKDLDSLKLLADYYHWEKQQEEALERSEQIYSTALWEGWIPEKDLELFEKELYEKFPATYLEKIEPEEDEPTPLQLQNKEAFRPFEIVTKIFGLPAQSEMDPTPYLAPFFVFFFAFCLTDAGYGILLTAMTFFALKFLLLEDGMRQMMRLLFVSGIMTIILGALFGGWFGIEVEKLPAFLQSIQIFDPIADLQTRVAPLAFGLGFIQLWLGVLLSGITKVRNGNVAEAWQSSFTLAIALLVAVAWGALGAMGQVELALYMQYTFYALLVVLLWGFGYGTKNIILRPIVGFIGIINEAMSWLSNLLSYSRLFALGLATGIVAQVFNSLAFTMGALIPVPVVNIFVILGILLFGHFLNIALNLLGAFIHSGRLQFIEFFGKFVQGGGNQFMPFRKESKYLFVEA